MSNTGFCHPVAVGKLPWFEKPKAESGVWDRELSFAFFKGAAYDMLRLSHSRNRSTLEKVRCEDLIISHVRLCFFSGMHVWLLTSKHKDGGNARDSLLVVIFSTKT